MNHRELMRSRARAAKFAFMALPEDLQDEVVDGLDARRLTLDAASDLLASRGYPLSHEAVASYYRAVRKERRLVEANREFRRVAAEFARSPLEGNLRALVNLVLAMAAEGLADGTVGIKNIDLARLLEHLPAPERPKEKAPEGGGGETQRQKGLTPEAAEDIRRKILGVER